MTTSVPMPHALARRWRTLLRGVGVASAVLLAGPLAAVPAHAEPAADSSWTLTGPDGGGAKAGRGPSAQVRYDQGEGRVWLTVSRDGRTVLEPSPVGIVTERADLSTGLRPVAKPSTRPVVERYSTTVGKRRERTAVMSETRFTFANQDGARLDLLVRVSADGVAYRYVVPDNHGAVLRETSAFTVPADATAWLARYRQDYENPFLRTTAGGADAAEFMHPALFDVAGNHLLITESDVDGRHSGGRLVHEAGSGTYRIGFWDAKIRTDGAYTSPWRTMIVGDLATVTESTLSDDLATPSKVKDTSWIAPGKVFWSWLAGGREAGQSLAMQQDYVDYAAAHGWPYALVDAGWYYDTNWTALPDWENNSWIPELIRYAAARGVKIQLWIHYSELDTAEERARRLPLFEKWGVAGLKIDFMDSDAQERFRWYDQILPETAKHHLMVNFHGSTLPHGIQRTWPHVMTMEAVHGGEKSSNLNTSHLTALPFTRNVVGSMDYTPEAFHRASRPTSDAHEVGLAVVFESGMQNFAGRIEDYHARPAAQWLLDQVPTVWDDTRLLAGTPADNAVFARRSGDRWFLGGGFSGAARSVAVPLSLPAGRWLVDLVRDSTDPAKPGLVREQRVLDAGQNLSLDVVKEGGFAGIACRWRPGIRSCDQPVRAVPRTAVTVTPSAATATPGASFEVTGRFTVDDSRPVSAVTLAPRVAPGWSVVGQPVTARVLRPGQSIEGRWTVTAPAAPAAFGYLDLPVVASFRPDGASQDTRVEDQETTRVHLWRPLSAGWSYVSDLPLVSQSSGNGPVEHDLTTGGTAAGDGRGIAIRQASYGKGLGTFAASEVTIALDGRCAEFTAEVGVDNEAGLDIARQKAGGTVAFTVLGDGVVLADSGTVNTFAAAKTLTADVTGVRTLTLRVTDGGDGTQNDRASWADARVRCTA